MSEPIHVLALRGSLPADTCTACGQPVALHFDTSGFHYVGCHGVASRRALTALVHRPLRDVAEWGDAYPAVTTAILDGLRVGCGVEVAQLMERLTADEALHFGRRLASIAVLALRASEARR